MYAVLCHADYLGLDRKTPMDRAIYAVDELTGFITAVALVRPNKSLDEVDVAAVRKKMKDKGFARAINREDITKGADQLGVELDEHIAFVIESLKPVASQLGIAGAAKANAEQLTANPASTSPEPTRTSSTYAFGLFVHLPAAVAP